MFPHFPYTNFHALNLDWVIKKIQSAVMSINGHHPDIEGNIDLVPTDVNAVASVNGISPDSNGNVNVGTVKSVNSLTPNAAGNVDVGTVKSVNGSTPDANGNVNLPTVAGVTSVNGIGPDSEGNVNVGTVKSVNSYTPDNNGNINVTQTMIGFPSNVYYVNAATGNDNFSGTTPNAAFATISRAFTVLMARTTSTANDITIYIQAGTYDERISVTLNKANFIHLRAVGGEVYIASIIIRNAEKLYLESENTQSYGITFKNLTTSHETQLMELTNCNVDFACTVTFDLDNAANKLAIVANGSRIAAVSSSNPLTCINCANNNFAYIERSTIIFFNENVQSNVTEFIGLHCIVVNAPSTYTINGQHIDV